MSEVIIEEYIHQRVDFVFAKNHTFLNPIIKKTLQDEVIRIDTCDEQLNEYLPIYDCLAYRVVSDTKCVQDYTKDDFESLEKAIEINPLKATSTFRYYSLKRLNYELLYFAKLMIHFALYREDNIKNIGSDFFMEHFRFIINHFPDKKKLKEYKDFWISILNDLKNNKQANVSFDYPFDEKPIGLYIKDELDLLIHTIESEF